MQRVPRKIQGRFANILVQDKVKRIQSKLSQIFPTNLPPLLLVLILFFLNS